MRAKGSPPTWPVRAAFASSVLGQMGDELAAVGFDWPDREVMGDGIRVVDLRGPVLEGDLSGIFNENAYIPGRYLP